MAMATTISLQLFLLVAVAGTAASRSQTAPAPASSSWATMAPTSFLRASCALTDIPDACYKILLPDVDTFQGNLARVARAASAFAGARQHEFTGELARLKLRGTGAGKVADMTLGDCFEDLSVSDAVANETLGHIDNLIAHRGSEKDFDWQRSLAQENLDSAQSGSMQCADWFQAAGEAAASSPVVKEVIAGCTTVSSYMYMALELVNAIKF